MADALIRRRDPDHAGRACIVQMFAVATIPAAQKHRNGVCGFKERLHHFVKTTAKVARSRE